MRDQDAVSRYRFATESADFVICSSCGVVPVVLSEIDAVCYAVVNVNVFDDVDESCLTRRATSFDGEAVADRLQRRQANWIPNVEVV